jgi:hypothetical protein
MSIHSGNIQGTFRVHSGNIRGISRERSGSIQIVFEETFREHSENIQGTFGDCTCSSHALLNHRTPAPNVGGLLSEHSGKDQGTFSAHSRPIHGTFRAHSWNVQFELRWMPVSPHPNCEKHLKKVPRFT